MALAAVLIGIPATLDAQGSIILQGRVTTASGAPAAGARVTIANTETGQSRVSTTSENGSYVMLGLQPGSYLVQAQRIGFQPASREIRLLVGQRATLDFTLEEAARAIEGVRVTSEAATRFEVQRTDVSTPVLAAEIENLPLNSRNTLNLAAIVPGIKTFAPVSGRSLPAAGALPDLRFYNFYLDGVEWKSMFNGNLVGIPQTGSPIPQEALREFRLHLNPYDVEFTRGGSYIISAVTHRGTNETKGSTFLYFQNNSLRALDEFQRRARSKATVPFTRVDYNRKQFGLNVRGPVVKDRIFYALSYEQNNISDAITVSPGQPAYNPTLWDAFRGDHAAPTQNHTGVARLTATVSQAHTLDAIYAGRFYDSETFFGGRASRDAGISANYWVHSAQLRDTYTPTNSLVNQFSLHLLTWNHNELPLKPGPQRNYPSIFFGRNNFPLELAEKHFRATNKLTYTLPGGRHIFEVGADLERVLTSSFLPSNANGTFDYTTDTSSLPRQGTIAIGFTDPTSTTDALAEANGWVAGLYLQDRWQVRPTLTINLGIRYDADIGTLLNEFVTPWADVPELRSKLPAEFLVGERKNDLNNIAPRASFSWDVTGQQRTFLRGGWGLMFGRIPSTYAFGEKQASTWRTYTIQNPGTNDPDVLRERVIASGATARPNLSLVSREIKVPETTMMSAGVGHQITRNVAVNLDYVDQRSRNLYVNMAVNPVYAGARRLTSDFGNITLWDSFGEAGFRALTAGLTIDRTEDEARPTRGSVAYTLGFYESNFENFGGWVDRATFQMQPSSGDERHRLVLSGMTPLKFGFLLSGFATIATPGRFVALEGRDVNQNGLFNDDFVNPARAIRPDGGFENWYRTLDLRLARKIGLPQGTASLSVEMFNVFNSVNWSGYGGTRADQAGNELLSFRQPTGTYAPRQLQVGVRYAF